MKPLAPNTMIQNRYLVVHLIGKGGMGEVYLAVDQRLGSAIALKRTYFADDETLGNAFEREAKILARLRHPVLPKVSDHFGENGDQYLVMEHISGDDLSKRLETANKPFPVSWVMFWADQLLDALSYLHSHEPPIIHRDIKPQNLKLTDENHIVLLDFGLSKDSSGQTVASKPGSSGSLVGYTPHFASMEQIRGTGTDSRSDIYSLSATLYQLMTNTVPIDALSRADEMLNDQKDPIIPLSQANPEISPAVSNVILKGLEVSKEKRFNTASEMQKALRTAYSQIQNQMSAETQVFSIGDIQEKTPSVIEQQPVETAAPTPNIQQEPALEIEPTPNYDATLAMDASEAQEVIKQADVQTEFFNAAQIASNETVSEISEQSVVEPSSLDVTQVMPTVPEEPPTPAATEALISIDQNDIPDAAPAAPEFFTAPVVEVKQELPMIEDVPAETTPEPAAPVKEAPTPKAKAKGAGSKAFLLLGGLGLFFIVVLGVLGGGWYYYANYYSAAETTPTPTPTPSPTPAASPSPSPTPSPSMTPETNTNTDNNGSNVKTVEPTPEPTQPPVIDTKPPSTPLTRETPVRPVRTPGPKATPKPRTNNDRTVILQ